MINKETAMQRMADWKNPDFNVPEEELSDALFWLAKERFEAD